MNTGIILEKEPTQAEADKIKPGTIIRFEGDGSVYIMALDGSLRRISQKLGRRAKKKLIKAELDTYQREKESERSLIQKPTEQQIMKVVREAAHE